MTFHLDDGFSISRELHTRTGCQLLHMFMMPIFDDFKRRPLFIIIRGGACIHRFQWKRPALFKQLKQKRSFPVLWLPCFWWAPFRSFGVCGVISARIGSSIFSDVIAKVSSLKKIQQDHISYIGIESFSAAVILSQAGKDHEKSSEHESKDKQAAKQAMSWCRARRLIISPTSSLHKRTRAQTEVSSCAECSYTLNTSSFIRHSAINFILFCSLHTQSFNQSWLSHQHQFWRYIQNKVKTP